MSKSERRKGQDGELEVARIFQAAGFDCNRTPNSGALRITGDLYGDVPAHVEVKRQERLQLPAWLRQAAAEAPAGSLPVVAFRQNGGEWYASLPLSGLVELLAVAGLVDANMRAELAEYARESEMTLPDFAAYVLRTYEPAHEPLEAS